MSDRPAPTAPTTADGQPPPARARAPWAALIAVSAGLFLAVLSTTMVSVALPTLGRSLGVSPTGLEWTVDAYVLVYAALLIPGGVVGDRLGRKGVFLTGTALFGLGSLGCALATEPAVLLAGRVVQGIGPALLVPGSLTIIRAIFDDPRRRSIAIGVWSTGAGLAMAIGPAIGGLVVDGPGWRWVFGGNVPLAAVVAALAAVCVPRLPRTGAAHPRGAGRFDGVGAVASAATVGLLAFGAIEGQSRGWTAPLVIAAFVAGAGLAAGFVWWEGRCSGPLIDVSLFGRPTFAAANLAAVAVFFAFIGAIVYFSVYFQQVQGRSAVQAGLCIAPLGIAYALAATAAGRLVGLIGERAPLVGGLLLAGAATLALLRLRADTPFSAVWWNFAVLGVGVGLCGTPISTLAMSAVDVARAGMASAVLNAARQVGQVFGVAVLGALVYAGLPGGAEAITRGDRGTFVTGLHHALLLSGIVLIGSALAIAPLLRTRSAVAAAATR